MTTTICLVRHGRTSLNAEGRFRGRRDPPLDHRGVTEASKAARVLLDEDVDALFTSPLLRAVQTAEIIDRAAGVGVITVSLLTDADYGRWEGLTPDEARAADPEAFDLLMREPRRASMPGGESLPDVERRVLEGLAWAAKMHPGGTIAAVSHEIPIRLVIAALASIDGSEPWDVELQTGAIVRLRHEDGAFSLACDVRVPGPR